MYYRNLRKGIFISYRRHDTAGYSGRLYDRLRHHFGEDNLFMDIDTIDSGMDFVVAIEEAVGSCVVLIAVIGQRWLASADYTERRRLENQEDFMLVEIATALARDIRVIPVLVEDALMPMSMDLPYEIKKLARCSALEISDRHFHHDVGRLIDSLERVQGVTYALHETKMPQAKCVWWSLSQILRNLWLLLRESEPPPE